MLSLRSALILLFMAGIILPGCMEDESPPPDLIEESTYIDLMVEMQMVKSLQETIAPDSAIADSIIPKIMNRYGVTEDQFQRSHSYYQQQVSEQQRRISEAIERLRMDRMTRDSTNAGPELN